MRIEKNDRRRGSALVLVMMMSVFTMGLWAVSFRTTRDAIETEGFHNDRTRYEQRIVKGLAWAGEMLQTGQPLSSRYAFLYTGRDSLGTFHTRVEIRSKGDGEFAVTARPAKTNEVRRLHRNPTRF